MKLAEYKRPPNDNGRGLMGPSTPGWNGWPGGFDPWMRELVALGCKWFYVVDDGGNSQALCERLLDHAIFPVVRLLRRDPPPNEGPEPNPGHLNPREAEAVKRLVNSGVRYFETNTEPDLGSSWKNRAQPVTEEAAQLVALNWLFDARIILEAGGYPGIPAVSSGGDFPLLQAIADLGRTDILEEGCWMAVHNLPGNRPLDFPDDPVSRDGAAVGTGEYDLGQLTPWVWWNPLTGRPDTLEEVNERRRAAAGAGRSLAQDHACFREFEHYAALTLQYLGASLPLLSTRGGYEVGCRDDLRYARITPQVQAERSMALWSQVPRLPDPMFCVMAGYVTGGGPPEAQDWYGDHWASAFREGTSTLRGVPPIAARVLAGPPLPVVAAVKSLRPFPRVLPAAEPAKPAPPEPPPSEPEPLIEAPLREPAAPPPPAEKLYVVQEGETLLDVAQKFGVTVRSLIAANQIEHPNANMTGRQLVILLPSETGPAGPHLGPATRPRPAIPTYTRESGLEWDARLDPLHVALERAQVRSGQWVWKLVRAEYLDPDESGAQHAILYVLLDETGAPLADQVVIQSEFETRIENRTDEHGLAVAPMWAGFFPEREERGPYAAWVKGLPSDRVTGFGLPAQNPVSFRLIFQKTRR